MLPPRAAPACTQPGKGAQGGGGGPRKVSRTGPAAREPSAGSCASAQPGSAPGRAAYQQNETRGDRRADSSRFPVPRCPPLGLPTPHPGRAAAPRAGRSPRGKLQPQRPHPPAPPRQPRQGLFAAVINKEGRQAHPSKSCCMRPSQPPRTVLFKTRLTNMRNLSSQCCASPHPPRWLPRTGSQRERERASKRERERGALADLLKKKKAYKIMPWRCAGPIRWGLALTLLRGALPRGAALGYAPRQGPAREGCSRSQELLGPAREGGGRASIRGRGEGGDRAAASPKPRTPAGKMVSPPAQSWCH